MPEPSAGHLPHPLDGWQPRALRLRPALSPLFTRVDLGAVFVIVPDPERAAQFFRHRRLAEQAGLFEPGEGEEIAQARQSHSARNAGVVT